MAPARKLKELETRVGYHFKDRALLKKALTHASVRQASAKRRDNERLEFLGDRVLGLAVAELLSESIPPPAKASSRASTTGWCAAAPAPRSPASSTLAHSLVLERVGSGQRRPRQGNHSGRRLRGPARRHLPGGGLREGARRGARALGRRGSRRAAEAADAKSALQEWAQGQGLDLPHYVEVDRAGTRSRSPLHRRGPHQGQEARARRRRQQARGRAGRGGGAAGARGRVEARK